VNWTWDFNPAVLIALAGAMFASARAWFDQKNRSDRACEIAAEAKKVATDMAAKTEAALAASETRLTESVERFNEQIAAMVSSFGAYREVQAERIVTREILHEVETRMRGSVADGLREMRERLDLIIENQSLRMKQESQSAERLDRLERDLVRRAHGREAEART
jgi:hypothetical protein